MTHTVLNGKKRDRKLNDPCEFCGAQAGHPCENDYNQRWRFYCPDPECDQLYESIHAAMNCAMHNNYARQVR